MYHVSSQKANSFPDIPADVLPALWHIARFVSVKALTHTHTNSASHTPTQTQTQIFPFHAHCAARTVYIKVLIRVSPEELKCISVAKSCSLACESCSLRGGSRPSEIPLAHGRTIHLSSPKIPPAGLSSDCSVRCLLPSGMRGRSAGVWWTSGIWN